MKFDMRALEYGFSSFVEGQLYQFYLAGLADAEIRAFTLTDARTVWPVELLERYTDKWDWGLLSACAFLPWSDELVSRYADKWDWRRLSANEALLWSREFISENLDKLDWNTLNDRTDLDGNMLTETLESYVVNTLGMSLRDYNHFVSSQEWLLVVADLGVESWFSALHDPRKKWPLEVIEEHKDKWDWGMLSSTLFLDWSDVLIETYKDEWDWKELSLNKYLPWSDELIERYADKWDFDMLAENAALPWSLALVDKYIARWNYEILSENSNKELWTPAFLNKYKDYLCVSTVSGNPNIPWTDELLDTAKDWIDWDLLCYSGVEWTPDTLALYEDRVCWDEMSGHQYIVFTDEILERFKDKWNWGLLVENKAVHWSDARLERFKEHVAWHGLAVSYDFARTPSNIYKFKDKWDFVVLSETENKYLDVSLEWSEFGLVICMASSEDDSKMLASFTAPIGL